MSFILDIIKYGLGQFGIQSKGNNPKAIAVSAITSVLDQKITNSIKKANSVSSAALSQSTANAPDPVEQAVKELEVQVKVDLKASTSAAIPVVYGTGFVDPLLVDVVLSEDNCTMWYAVAICETTGTDLNGNPSRITVDEIYWDGKRVSFIAGFGPGISGAADSPSVLGLWEGRGRNAKLDDSFSRGLFGDSRVKIYLYGNAKALENPQTVNGGSEAPVGIKFFQTTNTQPAYNLMPGWTTDHKMSNLIFALIRIDFDPERDVTKLGKLQFKVKNTLSNPADVINDYMTNGLYGGGIPNEEIDK